MSKLKQNKSGLLNPVSLLKYIIIILIFHETDYSIIFSEAPYQVGSTAEYFILLVTFILGLESKICQTVALLFSLSYALIRFGKFEEINPILESIRIIFIHCFIQVGLILEFLQKHPQIDRSNSQLVALGMLGRQFNYSTIPSSHRQQMLARNHLQLFGEIPNQQNVDIQIEPDIDTESIPAHLDQFYENVLNNLECGIYQLENILQPVKTINPFMSHIVLKEDHLSEDYLTCQLHDFNFQIDSQIQIWPKFNRSKDIQQFQNFIPTLDATLLNFENGNNGLKEIQLHSKNMLLKTIIENLLAFMHFKFIKTQNLIDFSLKLFVKKDNLYTSIVLSPILIKQKPQLIMYILDLTDGPLIQQLNLSNKNTDLLISDISQKIKQPLNCTISMLEITINQASKEVQEQFLNPALAGCKLLINHANDILDYVTIKNKGHLELQQLDVHLKDFLLDAITIVQSQAIFRGLKINLHIRSTVPQFIRTDPNRLRQIISNLLTTIIQVTIQGKIEILAQKSVNQLDHVEIVIKVMATETNFSILKVIDKTVRYFKQLQLKNSPVIDLASAGRQFSQSIIIAFYLSLNLSSAPIDYNYERIEQKEYFNFLILIKNNNPNFQSQLSVKRQSALITFQQSVRQQFSQLSVPLRHQSTKFSNFCHNRQSIHVAKFGFQNSPNEENVKNVKQDMQSVSEEQEESQQEYSESSNDSEDEIELQLDKIINKEPQFMDFVNEDNKKLPEVLEQQQNSRDSILTFGGRSSLYSSIRYSSSTMQPNDLIDCFEKMEKIKKQKFAQKCECCKIFISEINDYDLYALSHQLQNIGITYEFTMQRNVILEKIGSSYTTEKICCKGLCLIFIAVDEIEDELIQVCNQIKELNNKYKKDLRIVALVGLQDDEFRKQIKKLPFHDFLSKPIMIDALLFILAKWVKL